MTAAPRAAGIAVSVLVLLLVVACTSSDQDASSTETSPPEVTAVVTLPSEWSAVSRVRLATDNGKLVAFDPASGRIASLDATNDELQVVAGTTLQLGAARETPAVAVAGSSVLVASDATACDPDEARPGVVQVWTQGTSTWESITVSGSRDWCRATLFGAGELAAIIDFGRPGNPAYVLRRPFTDTVAAAPYVGATVRTRSADGARAGSNVWMAGPSESQLSVFGLEDMSWREVDIVTPSPPASTSAATNANPGEASIAAVSAAGTNRVLLATANRLELIDVSDDPAVTSQQSIRWPEGALPAQTRVCSGPDGTWVWSQSSTSRIYRVPDYTPIELDGTVVDGGIACLNGRPIYYLKGAIRWIR